LPIESFANPILAAIDTLLSCTNIDRTEIEAHDTCTLNKLLCRFTPQGTIVAGGRLKVGVSTAIPSCRPLFTHTISTFPVRIIFVFLSVFGIDVVSESSDFTPTDVENNPGGIFVSIDVT